MPARYQGREAEEQALHRLYLCRSPMPWEARARSAPSSWACEWVGGWVGGKDSLLLKITRSV